MSSGGHGMSMSGASWSGHPSNFNSMHVNSFNHDGQHNDFNHHHNDFDHHHNDFDHNHFHNRDFFPFFGFGFPFYGYGGYGYGGYGGYSYPYWDYGGYVNNYPYSDYGYDSYGTEPDYGYPDSYAPETGAQYGPMPRYADISSRVTISAPAGAEVWVDGNSIGSVGSSRVFRTPPLDPDRKYRYTIRATWAGANGRPVTQSQDVVFPAGQGVAVHFPGPSS
jgi:uncharacterized protein (TIGR03000 family)